MNIFKKQIDDASKITANDTTDLSNKIYINDKLTQQNA